MNLTHPVKNELVLAFRMRKWYPLEVLCRGPQFQGCCLPSQCCIHPLVEVAHHSHAGLRDWIVRLFVGEILDPQPGGGGGGTPLYKLYRCVPPQRAVQTYWKTQSDGSGLKTI